MEAKAVSYCADNIWKHKTCREVEAKNKILRRADMYICVCIHTLTQYNQVCNSHRSSQKLVMQVLME